MAEWHREESVPYPNFQRELWVNEVTAEALIIEQREEPGGKKFEVHLLDANFEENPEPAETLGARFSSLGEARDEAYTYMGVR